MGFTYFWDPFFFWFWIEFQENTETDTVPFVSTISNSLHFLQVGSQTPEVFGFSSFYRSTFVCVEPIVTLQLLLGVGSSVPICKVQPGFFDVLDLFVGVTL